MLQSPVTELEILWAARRVLADKDIHDADKWGILKDLKEAVSPEGMAFFAPHVSKFIRDFLEDALNDLREFVPESSPGDGGGNQTKETQGVSAKKAEPKTGNGSSIPKL